MLKCEYKKNIDTRTRTKTKNSIIGLGSSVKKDNKN
jgi:hypothetical protein